MCVNKKNGLNKAIQIMVRVLEKTLALDVDAPYYKFL